MGRGVSSGGGQSSLGYLFGSGEAPKPAAESKQKLEPCTQKLEPSANNGSARKLTASQPIDISKQIPGSSRKLTASQPIDISKQIPGSARKLTASQPIDISKQIPAGICGDQANNYFRADGQNCGNFITDRPSTKVHAAPGGGSSLGYLFGDGGK